MKKRILAVLTAAVMTVGLLTGCGSSDKTAADTTQAGTESAELKDFDVILDWYPNAIHTFMYMAQEKGYFAEEGLNVNLIAPAGVSDGITFPAAGKAAIGLYYMTDCTVGYADEGMDIEVIGTINQGSLSCATALKEKKILSPADFKGKKVGYSGSEVSKSMIVDCAKTCGVEESDFELIDVGFDIETAIISGNVDVCFGGMINHEVVDMQNKGYEIDYWTTEDYGTPLQYEIILVANKSAYEADPALYEGFLNACKKGFEDVKADKEAALDLLFANEDAENYALDRDVETGSLDILLDMEEKSGQEFLSMSADVWNTNTAWMLEKGLLKNNVDASEFVKVD